MKSRLSGAGANLSANSKAVGPATVMSGPQGVAIGANSIVTDGNNIAIGTNTSCTNVVGGTAINNVVIGANAFCSNYGGGAMNNAVVIGANSYITSGLNQSLTTGGIVIGANSQQQQMYNGTSICIGNNISLLYYSNDSLRLGHNTGGQFASSIALGNGAQVTASNQFVIGTWNIQYTETYIGGGISNANQLQYRIQASGGAGNNCMGNTLALAGGKHTGTPTSSTAGHVALQTSLVGAAASTANALVDRVIVKAGRLTLTNSSANNVVDVALPTLTGTAGMIRYEVYATDGTDVQVRRGSMQYSAVNKGGVYTSETAVTAEASSCSAGTLTATWGIANGTNKITLQVTPTSSLTTTTLYLCYQIENNSEQAITIL